LYSGGRYSFNRILTSPNHSQYHPEHSLSCAKNPQSMASTTLSPATPSQVKRKEKKMEKIPSNNDYP
jgi:hypothetical protein